MRLNTIKVKLAYNGGLVLLYKEIYMGTKPTGVAVNGYAMIGLRAPGVALGF